MSRIDILLKKHCPDGVEYRALGKALVRTKGTKITAGRMKELHKDNAPLKIFAGGKTVAFVDFADVPEKDINREPSIIVKSRGVIEFEYYDKPFSHKNEMWSYYSKNKDINIKFAYYFLKIKEPYFQNLGSRMQMPQISTPDTDKFKIPLPPLPVQQEIVDILDAFTKLEAELEAELEARRQQYAHYRNSLLSFNEIGENLERERESCFAQWRSLGEVGMFIRGNGLQKKDFAETGVGCIHYGQLYTHYGTYADKTKSFVSEAIAQKAKKAQKGDLIITDTSEDDEGVCKAVAWLGDEEIAISNHTFIYKHSLNPKYVSYFFQTNEFQKQKRPYIVGVKVRSINATNLSKIKIPVPSPKEQERIVGILDKFDALVNDISSGLPAEITARRQQYEYYRNQLLTFQEAT